MFGVAIAGLFCHFTFLRTLNFHHVSELIVRNQSLYFLLMYYARARASRLFHLTVFFTQWRGRLFQMVHDTLLSMVIRITLTVLLLIKARKVGFCVLFLKSPKCLISSERIFWFLHILRSIQHCFFMVVHVISYTYSSKASLFQQRPSKDDLSAIRPYLQRCHFLLFIS